MADTKQQIELECQQVQEQLLRLTADREMLQKEFERITSCSQHLLQQYQDDSSQVTETKQSRFEIEKQKLEEKLKALEINILDKDERIESLDSKASDYLLQVSTFSNSLFDNDDKNISEGVDSEEENPINIEKKEKIAEIPTNIVEDENIKCSSELAPEVEPATVNISVENDDKDISEGVDSEKEGSINIEKEKELVEMPTNIVQDESIKCSSELVSELEPDTVNISVESNDKNISEGVDSEKEGSINMEKEEELVKMSTDIVGEENIKCSSKLPSQLEPDTVNISVCDPELKETIIENGIVSQVCDEEVNLNVEVKTLINLVMEEVPVEKVPSESVEVSEACNKAMLATDQLIENIQGKIEENASADKNETLQLVEISGNYDNNIGDDSEVEVGDEKDADEIIVENQIVLDNVVNKDSVDGESLVQQNVTDGEKTLTNCVELGTVKPTELNLPPAFVADSTSTNEGAGKQSSGNGSPVREQMMTLSVLVAELRRVKDDMGKCMSVKEQSFIELEDQLQSANQEVASLKLSMAQMSKNLEEKEQSYQALEEENKKKRVDIELKMKEVQDVTNKCSMLSEEKSDILRKMEVLEIMMTEYRTEIEMLIAEKTKVEEQSKELLSAKAATAVAEAEIDSRTNVEEKEKEIEELVEKIQSMEKQMKELNDKLKVTNKHLKVMAREREHKQKECEVLKRKVETVELKMCELQGTFDMLVKAVMVERDELIKEMEEKNGHIDDMHRTLSQLKDTHEQELEKVMHEKRVTDDELFKYKSGQLKSVAMIEKSELDALTCEKEKLVHELKEKTEQRDIAEEKVRRLQDDADEFLTSLKEEMARLKDEADKTKLEKKWIEETFASLQAEHLDMAAKHKSMQKSFQELEKSNKEKTTNLEILKLQLDDLQQQLEDLNTKNFNLSSEMYSKEEEFREELSAREGTIQELNVTLTNNQKQSMENYNALQEDLSTLQTKFKTSVEENKKQLKDMEDKLKQSHEDKKKEVVELQDKVKSLLEELKEAKTELTESPTSYYQECESPSYSQDAELQSSSLAVVPSLPLDTVVDSSTTSHSLHTEAECREVDSKVQDLDALRKRGKELEDLLEVTRNKLESKEKEIQSLVEFDIPRLTEKIKVLTGELEELKNKSPVSEGFKSQAEFEAVIARKEEKIKELETKVSDLESCLVNKNGYISQLESRLEGSGEVNNDVDSHLEQIRKLSSDISKLKTELDETHGECVALKCTVHELETNKQNYEQEKAKIVEEYEGKLQRANSNLEEACADLEEKKKLG